MGRALLKPSLKATLFNQALHITAITLRSIAASDHKRYRRSKSMKLNYCLIATVLLFTVTCKADFNKDIDNIFKKWNNPDSPGCAVVVVKDQKIIYKKGFGSANLEYKIPISPKTIFPVASVSKQFTAFAVALLIQEGKINIDDDIHKYLPQLPKFKNKIKIKDLVYHTDGLRDQWDLLTFAGWNLYVDPATNNDVLKLIKMQRELNFTPGTEYLYGNTGYTLLAQIVEKVSGQKFPTYCEENIFKPLGMTNTFINDDYKEIVSNLAYSYKKKNNRGFVKSECNVSTYGADNLHTNVEDMVKWSNNFYSYKVGGKKLFDLITEPGRLNNGQKLNYGFGLEIKEYNGINYIGHPGGEAGYNTMFITFPSKNLSIIIFANLGSINSSDLAFSLADIFLESSIKTNNRDSSLYSSSKNPTLYKNLTGYYYSKKAGTDLKISTQNKRLYVELMGKKFELKNTINNEFVVALFPTVNLKFSKEGNTYSLLYQNNLEDLSFTLDKVNKDNLTIDNLYKYKGSYICPELNVTFDIDFSNDKLVMLRPRFVKSSLTPIFKDSFKASNGFMRFPYGVKFIRDRKDKIIGFNISTSIVTNRVRNLFFKRIN